MALSEFETRLHSCELDRTQILQSLALAVLKYLMQDIYYQAIYQLLSITKDTYYDTTHVLKSIIIICF